MNRRSLTLAVLALGLSAAYQLSFAAPPGADSWQMKRLFQPSQADLGSEAKGRVMIYDGLTDRAVARALDQQFDRVDSMMFTRIVVTDEDGAPRRDPDSGAVVHEDDGCD